MEAKTKADQIKSIHHKIGLRDSNLSGHEIYYKVHFDEYPCRLIIVS